MKYSVTFSAFCDMFHEMGRRNQFSYEGLKALFNYYEELEESTGENIECDVIAICCEWTEYTEDELLQDYSYLVEREEDESDIDYLCRLIDELNYESICLQTENTYLVFNF